MPTPDNPAGIVPRVEIDVAAEIPDGFAYWYPTTEELEEGEGGEGCLGFFHGTWIMPSVTGEDAVKVIRVESALVRLLISIASGPAHFDELADEIESSAEGEESSWLDAVTSPKATEADIRELGGLEIGVSGLVHVLAAIGAYPAASCRGHTGGQAWSKCAVVYFAAGEEFIRKVQPLVVESGCGLSVGAERSNLLVIEGPSILETMRLAELLLDKAFYSGS